VGSGLPACRRLPPGVWLGKCCSRSCGRFCGVRPSGLPPGFRPASGLASVAAGLVVGVVGSGLPACRRASAGVWLGKCCRRSCGRCCGSGLPACRRASARRLAWQVLQEVLWQVLWGQAFRPAAGLPPGVWLGKCCSRSCGRFVGSGLPACRRASARRPPSSSLRIPLPRQHYPNREPVRTPPSHWDLVGQPLFVTFRLAAVCRPTVSSTCPSDLRPSLRSSGPIPGPGPQRPHTPAPTRDRPTRGPSPGRRRIAFPKVSPALLCSHAQPRPSPGDAAREFQPVAGATEGIHGHRANQILNRRGVPFWQDESYDRLVRDDEGFRRVQHYIEFNPVTAGLAASPQEFRWSSAAGC